MWYQPCEVDACAQTKADCKVLVFHGFIAISNEKQVCIRHLQGLKGCQQQVYPPVMMCPIQRAHKEQDPGIVSNAMLPPYRLSIHTWME